jgi:radical SAM superfamily enzyme YgiQ (UPF0313 family)
MADIVIINPRFNASYWGLEHALPLFGKRANLPVACLPLLAALTPDEHRITLLDENVAPLDFDRIARADIVGVTGMIVQRFRMREILEELKSRGAFTVVGGPWITVSEDYFGDLVDVIFVGEAEDTWPLFLRQWETGEYQQRYEQKEKTDMSRVPCPRYDRLDASQYMFGSIQISRGCPFQCEFCDIIVTFGRRPRLKTSEQVIAELEAMRAQKIEMAFIVDDNLIGNKRAIKPVLDDIARWQRDNGYPFIFFTQASIDLADDEEILQVLVDANIQSVFIGVESPNEASLLETKKLQNLRSGGSMADKIIRIQAAGIEVWTGMIVGFDNDDETIFDAQVKFLDDARVVHAMFGMLTAIPKTPLYDRLLADDRLDLDDSPAYGTNVVPLRMTRETLRDGYIATMQRLNDVNAYFDRVDRLYHDLDFKFNKAQRAYWRRHPLNWLKAQSKTLIRSAVLYRRLMRQVDDPQLRDEYRRRIAKLWRRRREPAALFIYLIKCAMHYHYHIMVRDMTRADQPLVNTF